MNYIEYIYDRIIDPLNAHSGSVPLCALFPYFVAKHQACRNNSDKYLAFFLESAKNFLIFAMSIRTNDI